MLLALVCPAGFYPVTPSKMKVEENEGKGEGLSGL